MPLEVVRRLTVRKLKLALSVCLVSLPAISFAQSDNPIFLVVPYSAGGGTDTLGRMICESVQSQLKRPCIVENKPGAGTAVGMGYISRSDPKENRFLLNTSAFSIVPVMNEKAD